MPALEIRSAPGARQKVWWEQARLGNSAVRRVRRSFRGGLRPCASGARAQCGGAIASHYIWLGIAALHASPRSIPAGAFSSGARKVRLSGKDSDWRCWLLEPAAAWKMER